MDPSTTYSFWGALLLLVLAFWRYVDQRVKATNQAYWYVITLESQREGGFRQLPQAREDRLSHASGVFFKRLGNQVEYLLVQANRDPQEWVLPKGHIKPGNGRRRPLCARCVRRLECGHASRAN